MALMGSEYLSEPKIIVDLRANFTNVRDQGARPLCLAFSASDLNSYVNGVTEPLSVEFLAYHSYNLAGIANYNRGLSTGVVSAALERFGQPPEYQLPYNCLASAPQAPNGNFSELFHSSGTDGNLSEEQVSGLLDSGEPVVACFHMPSVFFNPNPPYVISDGQDNVGGHAVVVVGYGAYPDGKICFLIRNSWGGAWCQDGHAWVTADFFLSRTFTLLRLSL